MGGQGLPVRNAKLTRSVTLSGAKRSRMGLLALTTLFVTLRAVERVYVLEVTLSP